MLVYVQPSNEALLTLHLLQMDRQTVFHRAYRAIQMVPPSLLVLSQGWELIDLQLRALNYGLAQFSSPPQRGGWLWSPLRASGDHRFIVGALRAQRPHHSPP